MEYFNILLTNFETQNIKFSSIWDFGLPLETELFLALLSSNIQILDPNTGNIVS